MYARCASHRLQDTIVRPRGDGVPPEQSSYLVKQRERAAAGFAWLASRTWSTDAPGLVEIALATTIGWVRFRQTYPIEQHPGLVRCFEALDARPSFASTRPHG